MSIEKLFKPRSIAVIGASANPQKLGYTLLNNLIEGEFAGSIYPINKHESSILGYTSYPSLGEIDGPVDLIVIAVPSVSVPAVVKEAVEKQVGAAIIVSGGFREAGNAEGEREVLKIAKAGGLRIVGPNCQGLAYTPNRLCATWPLVKGKGSIAVVSQSGTVAAAIAGWSIQEGLGVSCMLALGNKSDVNEAEVVEFLANDGITKVIVVYSEGLGDGRKFMDTVAHACEHTPIILLRGGRTSKGHDAAQTHTKSLAGRYEVFTSLAEASGGFVVSSIDALFDAAKSLGCITKPKGNRIALVTSSGGSGVLATDAAVENGLELSQLNEGTMQTLRSQLPSHCSVRNPIDLTGDATSEMYSTVLTTLARDSNVDAIAIIFGDPIPGAADMIIRIETKLDKPLIVTFLGGGEVELQERRRFAEARIPVFPTPERAMRGLGMLVQKRA